MKNFFIVILYFCFSCQSRLEIQPSANNVLKSTVLLPDFNFRIRVPSGTDVIRSNEFQLFSVYLRQLEFYVPNQAYSISFLPTNNYDGNIEYRNKLYRPNDLIIVYYDSLINNELLLKLYPVKPSIGTFQVQFSCFDKAKRTKIFIRTLTVNP